MPAWHHLRDLTEMRSSAFREALSDVADGIRSAAEGDLKDLAARR
jgi:hypothetical protein